MDPRRISTAGRQDSPTRPWDHLTEARPGKNDRSAGGAAWTLAGAWLLLVPYFPWRFDLPDPSTIAIIAAVLLFCAWRACRRS
ncbi:MAG: hypothetical protein ACP5UT_09560 [Bryobacteraceae bacterium]